MSSAAFLRKVRRRFLFACLLRSRRFHIWKVLLKTLRRRCLSALMAVLRVSLFRIRSLHAGYWNRLYLKISSKIERRKGALFVGYAEGNLGLGQVFRNNLQAAETAGLSFGIYPLRFGIEKRLLQPFMPERYDKVHAYDLNIILAATEQLPNVLRSVDVLCSRTRTMFCKPFGNCRRRRRLGDPFFDRSMKYGRLQHLWRTLLKKSFLAL